MDKTGFTWRETEHRTKGDRTIPLFFKWFLDSDKQSHFGCRYSSRNIGCKEITSISSALWQQTWRGTLSGVWLSKRNRVTRVKSRLHMSKKLSCFDSVFEIILKISWTGAFFLLSQNILAFQTAHSDFVFMFSLDTKATNKRLYQCVIGQLTQSHTEIMKHISSFLHTVYICSYF